jgi:hypothetical protein
VEDVLLSQDSDPSVTLTTHILTNFHSWAVSLAHSCAIVRKAGQIRDNPYTKLTSE